MCFSSYAEIEAINVLAEIDLNAVYGLGNSEAALGQLVFNHRRIISF